MRNKKSILFIVKNEYEASSRFRVFSYLKQLNQDFEVSVFYAEYKNKNIPKMLRSLVKRFRFLTLLYRAHKTDIVFMQRPMSSDKSKSTFFENLLVRCNSNLIFDFDDALFVQNENKIKSLISLSKICICGNNYLADFSKEYNQNTYIIPTPIDSDKFTSTKKTIKKETITIGWTGTSGNYDFFTEQLIEDIQSVLQEYSNVNFLFICDKKPTKRFNFSYDFIKWNERTEVDDLRKIDIGLMPLIDSPWTKGKCGFKLIQYGTISIPSLASNVGVNQDVILNGETGYIIDKENTQWREKLIYLINHPEVRERMGLQARQHIEDEYSVRHNYPKLKAVLNNLIQ